MSFQLVVTWTATYATCEFVVVGLVWSFGCLVTHANQRTMASADDAAKSALQKARFGNQKFGTTISIKERMERIFCAIGACFSETFTTPTGDQLDVRAGRHASSTPWVWKPWTPSITPPVGLVKRYGDNTRARIFLVT